MLVFPKEIETHVHGIDGVIYISQFGPRGNQVGMVTLTVHQFQEIWNREKKLIAEAQEEQEDEE